MSWLNRDVEIASADGEAASIDLIESYVPLSLGDDGSVDLVFHLAKDVTEALERDVTATQTAFRNTILGILGTLLGILAVLVFGLDLRIARRNRTVLAQEQVVRQELGNQNRELQRLDDAKNEFLSSLSHELKTPLAAIMGFTHVLKKNSDDNLKLKQMKHLEIVERNSQRLDSLINDLLDLSRIQTGRIKLATEEAETTALLRNVVDGFLTILDEKGQQASLVLEHPEAWLKADQTRIAQVLTNLISNASKYSPRNSSIGVTSRLSKDEWVVSVADEGHGISKEDQQGLFTMFYRTPGAQNSSVAGTGIGLFVSKQIVELHGGQIKLESSVGQGTTVTFRLPGVTRQPGSQPIAKPAFSNKFDEIDDAV